MEHHSNSVNWQYARQRTGARLVYIELTDDYQLDMEDFNRKLSDRTKILSFTGASNVLSTSPDIMMVAKAQGTGAAAIVDGAQLVPHERVDVQDLDCDFMAFSGHKMLAPWHRGPLWQEGPARGDAPFPHGGEMIEYVYDEESTFADLPYKFEAGTQM